MPDPGEPLPPNPEDFEDFDDYIAELAAYSALTSDPVATEIARGLDEIEDYVRQRSRED